MPEHSHTFALGDVAGSSGSLCLPVVAVEFHPAVSASHDGLGNLPHLSGKRIGIALSVVSPPGEWRPPAEAESAKC